MSKKQTERVLQNGRFLNIILNIWPNISNTFSFSCHEYRHFITIKSSFILLEHLLPVRNKKPNKKKPQAIINNYCLWHYLLSIQQ